MSIMSFFKKLLAPEPVCWGDQPKKSDVPSNPNPMQAPALSHKEVQKAISMGQLRSFIYNLMLQSFRIDDDDLYVSLGHQNNNEIEVRLRLDIKYFSDQEVARLRATEEISPLGKIVEHHDMIPARLRLELFKAAGGLRHYGPRQAIHEQNAPSYMRVKAEIVELFNRANGSDRQLAEATMENGHYSYTIGNIYASLDMDDDLECADTRGFKIEAAVRDVVVERDDYKKLALDDRSFKDTWWRFACFTAGMIAMGAVHYFKVLS